MTSTPESEKAYDPSEHHSPATTGTISLDKHASSEAPIDLQLRAIEAQKNAGVAQYYNRDLYWTREEEAVVIRKLDWRLFTAILLSTFVLNVDRTNISNAISAGLPADLGFTTDTVNAASQVYFALFSLATVSGAILGKKFGPQRYIPILMLAWGIVTLAHAAITNKSGYYAVRSFIAITEGGVIPATLVYLSFFYKAKELATRLSIFWGVQSVASAVSGLMAAGILKMHGIKGLEGWKWLFIIDGIFTVLAAFFLWFYLPTSVDGKILGFTEKERSIAATRTIRDDPSKVAYLTTQVTLQDAKELFTERGFWGHIFITIIGLTAGVPLATYMPSVIKTYKFDVFISNALTAPIYVLSCLTSVANGWHSDRTKERGWHGVVGATWFFVGFILVRFIPGTASRGVRYFGILIAGGWPATHPLNIAWMQENVSGVGKRTLANGMIIGAANIYGIWASQIYRNSDRPYYHVGNEVCIGFTGVTILLWIYQKYQYVITNKKRAQKYHDLSPEEKEQVEATFAERGSKSLLFRYNL